MLAHPNGVDSRAGMSDSVYHLNEIRGLVYVEARGKYCRLRSVEKAEEVKIRFQDIYRQLEPDSFIQGNTAQMTF